MGLVFRSNEIADPWRESSVRFLRDFGFDFLIESLADVEIAIANGCCCLVQLSNFGIFSGLSFPFTTAE